MRSVGLMAASSERPTKLSQPSGTDRAAGLGTSGQCLLLAPSGPNLSPPVGVAEMSAKFRALGAEVYVEEEREATCMLR